MKISKKKQEKISEQILAMLYTGAPKSFFTSQIAQELARDEEFIKKIILELKKKGLIVEINKNTRGLQYLKRQRWAISDLAYAAYQKHQR